MIRYIFTLFPVILCLKTQSFIWPQHKLFSVNVCRIIRIITQQFMILFPLRLHLYCDFFSYKIIENDNFFLLICSLICKNICVFSFQKFNTSFRNYFLFFSQFDQSSVERRKIPVIPNCFFLFFAPLIIFLIHSLSRSDHSGTLTDVHMAE